MTYIPHHWSAYYGFVAFQQQIEPRKNATVVYNLRKQSPREEWISTYWRIIFGPFSNSFRMARQPSRSPSDWVTSLWLRPLRLSRSKRSPPQPPLPLRRSTKSWRRSPCRKLSCQTPKTKEVRYQFILSGIANLGFSSSIYFISSCHCRKWTESPRQDLIFKHVFHFVLLFNIS